MTEFSPFDISGLEIKQQLKQGATHQ